MKDDQKVSISVVVPVYNVESYLGECLNSLAAQTIGFFEIILVNDGSTDQSGRICEEYCSQFSNMMLINQNNQGLSSARNSGLRYANGDYIIFVDSDDYVTNNMNESIQEILLKEKVDILYYNADVVDELHGEYTECLIRSEYLNGYVMSGIQYLEKCFPNDYRCSACLAAYKKAFLDKNGILFPSGLYYEDNIFFIKTVLRAKSIFCVPDCFYIRRLRNDSIMTGKLNIKKCFDHIAINVLIWRELMGYPYKDEHLQFYRKYISTRMMSTFHFLDEFTQNTEVNQKMHGMMETFVSMWMPLYGEGLVNWNDACALQLVYNFLYDSIRDNDKDDQTQCVQLRNVINRVLEQNLCILPLKNMRKQVGIYGIGKHTKVLLELYQRYIGEINCELFFIVSERKQAFFEGRTVITYNEVPLDTDIIISSRIYQNEMMETLLENGIKKERIVTLYELPLNRTCDVITFAEIEEQIQVKEKYKGL